MSARVEIDASGSQAVMDRGSWSYGWISERRVEVDLRLSFDPADLALAERELDKAVARARAELGRFQL